MTIVSTVAYKKHTGENHTREIQGIVRIFMHTPNEYSFLMRGDGSLFELKGITPVFISDVPKEKDMWIYCGTYVENDKVCMGRFEIHIHEPGDVSGGGWVRSRKFLFFSSGEKREATQVIQ
ncbi:MAG: hypothetical protein AAB944_01840 [Patescibacteria group bacterium]